MIRVAISMKKMITLRRFPIKKSMRNSSNTLRREGIHNNPVSLNLPPDPKPPLLLPSFRIDNYKSGDGNGLIQSLRE